MKHWHRALAAVLVALAIVTGSATAKTPSCRVPGGHVVASGTVARLVSVPTPDGAALFACIRRSGHKIALDDSFTDARIVGRWVTWQRAGRPGHWRIAVHDLRTGHERLVDGHVASHSLRLTARGSIAWAQTLDSGPGTPLYANEPRTGGRLLDGGDVDATSVRLAGRRVTWFRADVQYEATLF